MAADPVNLKTAAIGLQRKLDPSAADKKLRDVAQLYEEQFLREMVKAMRGTVPDGGLVKVSQGETIYREQLDQNYVEQWGKQGGLGLQKLIYDQLIDKFGSKMGLKTPEQAPAGPIALDPKSNLNNPFSVRATPSANNKNVSFEFHKAQPSDDLLAKSELKAPEFKATDARALEIKAPWTGQILGSYQINPSEYVVEMSHNNGLKSQLVFRGSLANSSSETGVLGPRSVQAGENIGLLSPEAKSFFWTVGPSDRNQPVSE